MKNIFASLVLALSLFLGFISCNSNKAVDGEAYTPAQFDELIHSADVVIVDFKAEWCGPCKQLGPMLESMSQDPQFKGKVKLQKVDVDQSGALASRMGVRSIPYVAKYYKGVKVAEFVGVQSEENIRAFFAK